MSIKDFYPITN